jgi:hypothetical protein
MLFKPYTIFLSYSRLDEELAKTIYKKLTSWGYRVWMDQYEIMPGDHWPVKTMRDLDRSNAVLILTTPNFILAQGYVKEELHRALTQSKKSKLRIIPVLYQLVKPPDELSEYHYVLWKDAAEREKLRNAIAHFKKQDRQRKLRPVWLVMLLLAAGLAYFYFSGNHLSKSEAARLQEEYNKNSQSNNAVSSRAATAPRARFDAIVVDASTGSPLQGAVATVWYNEAEMMKSSLLSGANGHVRVDLDTTPGVRLRIIISCDGYTKHIGRFECKEDYYPRNIALVKSN